MAYAAGPLDKHAMPLRVLSLTHTGRFTVKFECEEYSEAIYTLDEDVIIDTPDYSSIGVEDSYVVDGDNNVLPLPSAPSAGMADVPSRIEDITAQEVITDRHGGGVSVAVRIDWEPATLPAGSLSRIDYYAVLTSTSPDKWLTAGTTKSQTFTLPDVKLGETIRIVVKPYTMYGVTNNDVKITEITPQGKLALAPAPKIIWAVQNGAYISIKWEQVASTGVSHYEIRQSKNAAETDWAFAKKITTTKSCEVIISAPASAGIARYLVATVDINGVRGAVASCTVDVYHKPQNIVYREDSRANGWQGKHVNMTVEDDSLSLTDYEGTYTTGYYDMGAVVSCAVRVDYDVAGFSPAELRWGDLPTAWTHAANRVWSEQVDSNCVEHGHEIATCSTLSSDICDVVRAVGKDSIKGVAAGYANGVPAVTDGAGGVTYQLASPATWAWSVYFQCKLTSDDSGGLVLARLGEASVAKVDMSTYRLSYKGTDMDVTLTHESEVELMFCVGRVADSNYFAVGDNSTGQFASISGDIGLAEFEEVGV
jgi:hypothetical protein